MRVTLLYIMLWSLPVMHIAAQDVNLDEVRRNLRYAPTNKAVCEKMINLLEGQATKSSTHLGYLGAYQAIWAEHASNPFSKLRTFNKGKGNVEKAITNDRQNVELRFIRYSIQRNVPKMLGYNKEVEIDRAILEKEGAAVKNPLVKRMITEVLKQEK